MNDRYEAIEEYRAVPKAAGGWLVVHQSKKPSVLIPVCDCDSRTRAVWIAGRLNKLDKIEAKQKKRRPGHA